MASVPADEPFLFEFIVVPGDALRGFEADFLHDIGDRGRASVGFVVLFDHGQDLIFGA